MKYIFTLVLALSSISLFAQTGSINGSIKSSDGQPAEFINVGLKEINKVVVTDKNGRYQIKNIKPGSYTLVASFIGLETKEMSAEVKANETTYVNEIILKENSKELSEVVVNGNKVSRGSSVYVSKMPLKNIENPQVYNTIDNKTLKEQVVTNFDDALKNAPGVEKLWESTGRGGDGSGYYSLRGFAVQPTMMNGLPGLTNGSLDPANIESIEVLKGPSGTLFGSSLISYGGLINTVTKKPYDHFGGEITYITGSYGLNRISADINTPVSKEKEIAFRLNTAYHTENSFQDAGFRRSLVVAPTLSYNVNDKLSFLVVAEFLNTEGTNPTMLFLDRGAPLTFPDMKSLNYDNKRSYTSNNLTIKNPTSNLQAQMSYKLSDKWISQTILSRGSARSNGYYSYLYEVSRFYPIEGMVQGRYVNKQNNTIITSDIQQNFIGDFYLGNNIKNKIVAGLDYYQNTSVDNSTGYVQNGLVYIGTADAQTVYDSVFNGAEETDYDSGVLSESAMDGLLASAAVSNSKTQQQTYSAYVSNVIAFESIGLSAMVSLRLDYFDTEGDVTVATDDYDQVSLSPKFGLVYQPVKDRVALFGNYMNGFMNVAPAQVADVDGTNVRTKTFEPEHANQMEFGIKTNLVKNLLTSTFSYYNINVKNKLMTDPTNINNSIQGGEVESKGFEVDLHTTPVRGLDISVGYSQNESTVIKGTPGQIFAIVGRRPSEAGPEKLFNAWATYRFTNGSLKGFGAGFGANAATKRLIMDSEATGTFALPAYTVMNASLFYNTNDYRITLKVDNLTNKEYYKGWSTINPQKPISVSASLTYNL